MIAEQRMSVDITTQKSVRNDRLKIVLRFGSLETLSREAFDYLEEAHQQADMPGGAIVLICREF